MTPKDIVTQGMLVLATAAIATRWRQQHPHMGIWPAALCVSLGITVSSGLLSGLTWHHLPTALFQGLITAAVATRMIPADRKASVSPVAGVLDVSPGPSPEPVSTRDPPEAD